MNLNEVLENVDSWQDFKNKLDTVENNKLKGDVFEKFTQLYFLSHYISKEYKYVWLFHEIPIEYKDSLNFPLNKPEHGVDLLLVRKDGSLVVVQCKYRKDESCTLHFSKDKISNLFAYGVKANEFLLFSNVSKVDEVSSSCYSEQFQFIGIEDLLNINPNTFEIMRAYLKGEQKELVKFTPKDYQLKAMNEVVRGFQNDTRGQLILPCGTGKTYISLLIKEEMDRVLDNKKTLFLVPSLSLLKQAKNVWNEQSNNEYEYLCVCSEDDIDKDGESPLSHTYEIGSRVTNDTDKIRNFLSKENIVIFSTYQSLPKIEKAMKTTDLYFDLAICDEAHKTAGYVENLFSIIHYDDKILTKKRLYMTATPRVLSRSMKAEDGELIADMSNEEIFGKELYRMSFKEAIEKKLLVDYKIIAVGITNEEVQSHIQQREHISNNETIDEIANNYALEKIMSKYNLTHGLTFHARVKQAKQFQQRHQKLYSHVKSYSVDGTQSSSERSLIINDFKNLNKAVISNARCLTEGVDVPAIDIVYFCDNKKSKVDIVQATGRALRLPPKEKSKEFGYVVVPIYHHIKDDVNEVVETSQFAHLIEVLRALSDHDARIEEEITHIVTSRGKSSRLGDSNRINYIGNDKNIIWLKGFEEKLEKSIFTSIVKKSPNVGWGVLYEEMKEWLVNNNDHYPSKKENETLYRWCEINRQKIKNGHLSRRQLDKLDEINFIWDVQNYKWEEQYEQLKEWLDAHDGEYPTSGEKGSGERALYSWCAKQRSVYKKGELTQERYDKLLSIGYDFDTTNVRWNEQYEQLKECLEAHDGEYPKFGEKGSGERALYNWCANQRSVYKKGELTQERYDKLLSIGYNFDAIIRKVGWDGQYEQLKEWLEAHDGEYPKFGEKGSGERALYNWCANQRHKKGELTQEQIGKLVVIGYDFDTTNVGWDGQYERLKEWLEAHDGEYPTRGEKGSGERALYSWCAKQRSVYKKGELTQERMGKLDEIGFRWGS